ncbi:hypothetical protein AB4Z29_15640 [Paenibacillus sp. 2TAB23]|uniref:hypothetical protein n=1 Tax=Paenibacillus sp. 2TAB23 TaxID=3233004 RepID=UPI003F99AD34
MNTGQDRVGSAHGAGLSCSREFYCIFDWTEVLFFIQTPNYSFYRNSNGNADAALAIKEDFMMGLTSESFEHEGITMSAQAAVVLR